MRLAGVDSDSTELAVKGGDLCFQKDLKEARIRTIVGVHTQ